MLIQWTSAGSVRAQKKCKPASSVLLSMDIKALYPSMRIEVIVRAVRELILESDLEAASVDYLEVGKYLCVVMSPEEIEA